MYVFFILISDILILISQQKNVKLVLIWYQFKLKMATIDQKANIVYEHRSWKICFLIMQVKAEIQSIIKTPLEKQSSKTASARKNDLIFSIIKNNVQ